MSALSAEAFAHPGSRRFTPSMLPRVPLLLPLGFSLGWGFFFCHLLANAEMSGLGPVPFADPLPAVRRRRGGKGPALTRGGMSCLGGERHLPAPGHRSVSLESARPRAACCFPALAETELRITAVFQQNKELRERLRGWEVAPVGVLGHRSSQDRDAPGEHRRFPAAGFPRPRRARAGAASLWLRLEANAIWAPCPLLKQALT